MRVWLILILLFAATDLWSQDDVVDVRTITFEQQNEADCIPLDDKSVRAQVSYYVVSDTVLYKQRRQNCFESVVEVADGVVAMHFNWNTQCLILWTATDEYRYYDSSGVIETYTSYGLLSPFLSRPVKTILASYNVSGCEDSYYEEANISVVDGDKGFPSLRHEHRSTEGSPIASSNSVSVTDIGRILRTVNLEPDLPQSLADCNIDEDDFSEYARQVRDEKGVSFQFFWKEGDSTLNVAEQEKAFRLGLLECFDTVSFDVIRAALTQQRWTWTTTSRSELVFVNDVNDTLYATYITNGGSMPYHLPWKIRYGGEEFYSFNIDLARILMKMLPNRSETMDTESAQNVHLLHVIADYLYSKHQEAQRGALSDTVDSVKESQQ